MNSEQQERDFMREIETIGTEVVVAERERSVEAANVLPSEREWEATLAIARQIAGTPFVPDTYRNQPEAVVAAILTGREMGIGPMQALRQIHMVDGRPAFAADLMLARMRAGGITILESGITTERAFIHARRRDTGEEALVEWTKADAEAAGLSAKKNWRTYPADMLWARCVGRLARRLGSDLLGGLVYSAEEVADFDNGNGYRTLAEMPRETDPATDLLDGAINVRTKADADSVRRGQASLDRSVNWESVETGCALAMAGKPVQDMSGTERSEFWRRLANAVVKAGGDGNFPGPTHDDIQTAYAWAFNGHTVTLTAVAATASHSLGADVDDIPFGNENEDE